MKYKNIGMTSKTFYGVTFKPKEVKEVPGYINDPKFIRMPNDAKVDGKAATTSTSTSTKSNPNTDSQKAEVK